MIFALNTCDTHAKRLQVALSHVLTFSPLTGASFLSLRDDQLGFIEFMISRFTKLQDTIGTKIFPALIEILEANPERQSFLDTLHKLEKWHFLPSVSMWNNLRELRNYLTHDYPDQPELMAEYINRATQASSELLAYWTSLKEKIQDLS
ncbi:MAG: hypothetical protein FJZ58_03780 [Chlamydiae bacterium]|nr:hypothetical protein [Chlamydiota bacterium]